MLKEKRRRFSFTFVVAVAFLTAGCTVGSLQAVDRGSMGPVKRSLNRAPHGYEVIPDPTGSAPTELVEKFEVRPGDCFGNAEWNDCYEDRERSELSASTNNGFGTEYWYGWWIYVPKDYVNVHPTKVALGQFHQRNGPPAFMFQNHTGGLMVDKNFGNSFQREKILSDDELRGTWNQIEVHAKWGRDGFFAVYANGELKRVFEGVTANKPIYFKYGLYRSFLKRYKVLAKVNEVPTQIVYYSNVRRARTREGLQLPQ